MTTKCNQTGCENPIPDFDDICVTCGTRYGKHFGSECPGGKGEFVPLKSSDQPDPEAVKCWGELAGHYDSDYLRRPTAIISRYLQKAREDASERLNRECDVLKDTNDKLRDQLCANTKLISELQHTVRLVQGAARPQGEDGLCFYCGILTNSMAGDPGQWPLHFSLEDGIAKAFHVECVTERLFCHGHIHECAVKAAKTLHHRSIILDSHEAMTTEVIESCFGVPAKDECEEALGTQWRRMELSGEAHRTVFNAFTQGFRAAWKLAKGDK